MDELAAVTLIALGVAVAAFAVFHQRRGREYVPEDGAPTPTGEPVGDAVAEELYLLEGRPKLGLAVLYVVAAAAIVGGIALLLT